MLRKPRDLTRADFQAKVSDAELLTVIRVGKGLMPAFGGLMADDDLRDVISYIRTLAPHAAAAGVPPVASPAVPPTSGAPPAAPSQAPASPASPASGGAPAPGSPVGPEGVNQPAAGSTLGTAIR